MPFCAPLQQVTLVRGLVASSGRHQTAFQHFPDGVCADQRIGLDGLGLLLLTVWPENVRGFVSVPGQVCRILSCSIAPSSSA